MRARTIAWGRCTPLTIVDQFGIKISGLTPSYEALGRLLKKKKTRIIMMTKMISRVERRRFVTTRKAFLWLAKGPLAISVGFWSFRGEL